MNTTYEEVRSYGNPRAPRPAITAPTLRLEWGLEFAAPAWLNPDDAVKARFQAKREANREANREKAKASQRAWCEKNPEKVRDKNHRRRARKRAVPSWKVTTSEWRAVVGYYGGLCAYGCGRPWEHQDHFVPLARAGPHAIWNLVPACGPCNFSKQDREWPLANPHPWMAPLLEYLWYA